MKKKIRVDKIRRWRARRSRVSSSLARTEHTRLTVYRSARHIYAQLIDPSTGSTIASASTQSSAIKGDLSTTGNVEAAKRVGTAIAGIAREKGIESVVFNRNGYLYHGRVKALAEAAREAGLQF